MLLPQCYIAAAMLMVLRKLKSCSGRANAIVAVLMLLLQCECCCGNENVAAAVRMLSPHCYWCSSNASPAAEMEMMPQQCEWCCGRIYVVTMRMLRQEQKCSHSNANGPSAVLMMPRQ
jgi:hypothetical protein